MEKLLAERDGKEGELVELLKLSPQDIWNRDLDNFLAEWEVSCAHDQKGNNQLLLEEDIVAAKGAKPKTKAAIKAAAKKKKRANGQDSDESDDFKPTKVVKKAAPKKAMSLAKSSPAKRFK